MNIRSSCPGIRLIAPVNISPPSYVVIFRKGGVSAPRMALGFDFISLWKYGGASVMDGASVGMETVASACFFRSSYNFFHRSALSPKLYCRTSILVSTW